ncbi:uncharacterized protein LOC135394786 [Ornithodoros turicata]|uniref:uncharacterized protein LOC135394786 n=1 Tax=Ornithodoros turicata TaxID=34597 RepID=UPI00313A0B3E
MAGIHRRIRPTPYAPQLTIYADDICLRIAGTKKEKIRDSADVALNATNEALSERGLEISPEKSQCLLCIPPSKHVGRDFPRLSINNIPVPRCKACKYLGVTIDSSLRWTKQVNETTAKGKKSLNLPRRISGKAWGCNARSMLILHRALILSRILYATPYVDLSPIQWLNLERLHRAGIRTALGLPSFSSTTYTYLESKEKPVSIHSKHRGLQFIDNATLLGKKQLLTGLQGNLATSLGRLARSHAN